MEKQNPLSYGGLLNGSAAAAEDSRRNCFFTSSWDLNPIMDQNDPFESALSSMVSSPATSSGGGENIVLRELIGRLGSICSSGGEISPHSYNNNKFAAAAAGGGGNNSSSTNTSCYNTPLNSPPKLNLSIMDPRHHQIRGKNNKNNNNLGSHLSSNLIAAADHPGGFAHEIPPPRGSQMDSAELIGDSMEISSLTEHITARGGGGGRIIPLPTVLNHYEEDSSKSNPRKRKSTSYSSSSSSKGKAKEPTSSLNVASENTDTNAKRSKSEEEKDDTKIKTELNGITNTDKSEGVDANKKKQSSKTDNAAKQLPDPSKDYIHVRARRGQATDAHSLAERVRREKISERMKLLQNLVPGCNKVTGKAVMLDEIINYVQSLQHQVEFLSMKLATVNPRSDLNVETHLSKDVLLPHGILHHNIYHQSDASAPEFPHQFYTPQGPSMQNAMPNGIEGMYAMNHLSASTSSGRNTSSIQMPSSDNFGEVPSEVPAFWGDDLHSLVQMGLGQNQTQNNHAEMKVEQ